MDEDAANERNRPRASISSFILISIILFLLTSHNGDEFLARHHYQDALQALNHQLSNYTAWANGTASNFTMVASHVSALHVCAFISCPS